MVFKRNDNSRHLLSICRVLSTSCTLCLLLSALSSPRDRYCSHYAGEAAEAQRLGDLSRVMQLVILGPESCLTNVHFSFFLVLGSSGCNVPETQDRET